LKDSLFKEKQQVNNNLNKRNYKKEEDQQAPKIKTNKIILQKKMVKNRTKKILPTIKIIVKQILKN
jgi:hypothetical protein